MRNAMARMKPDRGEIRGEHGVDRVSAMPGHEDLLDQDARAEHVGEDHAGGVEHCTTAWKA